MVGNLSEGLAGGGLLAPETSSLGHGCIIYLPWVEQSLYKRDTIRSNQLKF